MVAQLKEYEKLQCIIVNFLEDDVVRTSGSVNENSIDNDGNWDNAWDSTRG